MKIKALSVLAGVSAPLILTGPASAGFTGIKTVSKPNDAGLLICNVYADFDRSGDQLVSVSAVAGVHQLTIEVQGGTFFQVGKGGGTGAQLPPTPSQIYNNGQWAYDSFVSIGVKVNGDSYPSIPGQPSTNITLTPGFPDWGASILRVDDGAWAVTPNNPAGDPFAADYVGGANGQVFIGQFSTADGTGISGTFLLTYFSNGAAFTTVESFFHVPSPGALALLGTAGLFGARRRKRKR